MSRYGTKCSWGEPPCAEAFRAPSLHLLHSKVLDHLRQEHAESPEEVAGFYVEWEDAAGVWHRLPAESVGKETIKIGGVAMTTDNRTNEPTPEQVEAAAKALHETRNPWFAAHGAWGAAGFEIKQAFRESARAALVAAQGAARPINSFDTTAERVKTGADSLHVAQQAAKDIHEPSHDRVYCVRCGGNWPCQPAPVLPSSGVDEDKLAEVIGYAYNSEHHDPATHAASAVAEWLKGQGRGSEM